MRKDDYEDAGEDEGTEQIHWSDEDLEGHIKLLGEDEVHKLVAQSLYQETRDIEQRQQQWHQVNLWNATLYSNRALTQFTWGDTMNIGPELAPENQRTENLIQSIGGAMLSKAASSPVMPTPIPRGASFSTKRKIRKLSRWLAGMWSHLKCEELARQAFRDAYISGVGVIRVDHDGERLVAESVFFDNVIVDCREGMNRTPINQWRIRGCYPVESVEKRWGKKLNRKKSREYASYRTVGDGYCVVVEAWAKGVHLVVSGDTLLHREVWDGCEPPLAVIQWGPSVTGGFHGTSGVEQVVPYQLNINNLNKKIRIAESIALTPRLLVQTGTRMNVNQMDNTPGEIWSHSGPPPTPFIWPTLPEQLYAERDRERMRCLQDFGISEMSASSQLPQGVRLDSSAAVREFRNMEDTRFLDLWTRYEVFRMDLAKKLIEVMFRDPSAESETVWYTGGRHKAERIDWAEIGELTEDMFSWSMEPVALASLSPAARRDTLESWLAQGLIGPDEARQMSGHPDLEATDDLESASIRAIHRMIEKIEDGDYQAPDGTSNLVYGIPKFLYALNDLDEYEDVPDEVYEGMREWLRVAMSLQNPVVTDPTAQAPGPGPTMGVGGVEMPNNNQGLPGQPFAPPAMPGPVGQPGMIPGQPMPGGGLPPM